MICFPKSLRWRIQLWHGLLLAIVVAGFCIGAWHYESKQTMQRINAETRAYLSFVMHSMPGASQASRRRGEPMPRGHNELRRAQLDRLAQSFNETARGGAPLYFVVWRPNENITVQSDNTPAGISRPPPPRSGAVPATDRRRGNLWEAFLFTPGGNCILVGRSLENEIAGLRRRAGWLGVIGGGVLICGLGVGWWLTGSAIRPISEIVRTSRHIASGSLDQRIPSSGGSDELSELCDVLNDTFAKLEVAFEQQERFTADAAHELRTPTTVILTQAQTALARDREPAVYREALEVCVKASRRLQHLGESLLRLSAFDRGGTEGERLPHDLASVAESAAELLSPVAAGRQITIYCGADPAPVRIDRDSIEQVALNLISNAIHFSPDGSSVQIRTGVDSTGSAILVVEDQGEGMNPRDLEHIFERFYRADESRNRCKGGAGLGLAICQQIARAHGGTVGVESEFGVGSVFTLKLESYRKNCEARMARF